MITFIIIIIEKTTQEVLQHSSDLIGSHLCSSSLFPANHWRPSAAALPPHIRAICPELRRTFFNIFNAALMLASVLIDAVSVIASVARPSCPRRGFEAKALERTEWNASPERWTCSLPHSTKPVKQAVFSPHTETARRWCSNMSGNYYKGHEVSCCIKYFIFGFNILFWVRGFCLCFISSAGLLCD